MSAESRAQNTRSKSGWRFRPVPTAVPPCGTDSRRGSVAVQALDAEFHLARPGGEFLAERDRHRVHHVGAADFDDAATIRAARASSDCCRVCNGGISACTASAAAMCIIVGKESLEDWPRLT